MPHQETPRQSPADNGDGDPSARFCRLCDCPDFTKKHVPKHGFTGAELAHMTCDTPDCGHLFLRHNSPH